MNVTIETIEKILNKHGADLEYARHYGERGYDDPENWILLSNWNHVKRPTQDWLESHGYSLEWSDEWVVSYENDSKAYRTSPDSYGWKPSYIILDDGDIIGRDDIESGDEIDTYIGHLLNDSNKADTFDVDWTQHGFVKLNDDSYESGFHPGQNDKPKDILKEAQRKNPNSDFIFSIDSTGQFDLNFSIWARTKENDTNED
jgi:hypothetical protein